MNFILRLLVTAAVAFGLAEVLPGVRVDTYWTAIVFALVLALLNFIVKPILIILTLPVTILTLGLFLFIINAVVVLLAAKFVDGFAISNIWWALIFAILLSVISSILSKVIADKD